MRTPMEYAPLVDALAATPRTAPRWMYKFQVMKDERDFEAFATRMVKWDNTRGRTRLCVPVDADPLAMRQATERAIRRAGFCAYYVWYVPREAAIICEWTVWEFEESAETCLDVAEYLRLSRPDVWVPDDMPVEARAHARARMRLRVPRRHSW